QRDGRLRPAASVRRDQALWLRTRAVRVRHPRVHEHPDDLDRAGAGNAAEGSAIGVRARGPSAAAGTRLATTADAAAIARIYNEGIADASSRSRRSRAARRT